MKTIKLGERVSFKAAPAVIGTIVGFYSIDRESEHFSPCRGVVVDLDIPLPLPTEPPTTLFSVSVGVDSLEKHPSLKLLLEP